MPQPIKIGTRPIPKALWPIFYSPKGNEKPTASIIRKRAGEHNPGPIERLSYLALGGIITTVIGAITGTVGFFKENSLGKWLGAALTFLGVEAFITGFFGSVDLSKRPEAKGRQAGLQFFQELSRIAEDKLTNDSIVKLAKKYNYTEQEIIKQGIEILLDENIQDSEYKEKIKSALNIIGLSKAKGENYIRDLMTLLKSDNAYLRIWAIRELGNTSQKDQRIDESLLDCLRHTDADIRAQGAISLAKRGNPNSIENLTQCISENKAKSFLLLEALAEFENLLGKMPGLDALNNLKTITQEGFSETVKSKYTKIKEKTRERAKNELFDDLKSKQPDELIKKYKNMGNIVSYLVSIVQNEQEFNEQIRSEAALTLTEIYNSPNDELNKIKKEKVILPLIEYISNKKEDDAVSRGVVELLGEILDKNDKDAIILLMQQITNQYKNPNTEYLATAMVKVLGNAFAKTNEKTIVDFLSQLLDMQIKDQQVRDKVESIVIETIGEIVLGSHDTRTIRKLDEIARDPKRSSTLRDKAVGALINTTGANTEQQRLAKVSPRVRPQTISSPDLKPDDKTKISGPPTDFVDTTLLPKPAPEKQEINITDVPKLVEIASTEKNAASANPARKQLKEFGQKTSTDDLITYLNGDNVDIGIWAAASLGIKQKKKADKALLICTNSKANLNVRASAAIALGRKTNSSDIKTVKAISNCLIECTQSDTVHLPIRLEATDVLTKIGTTDVLDSLSELKDDNKNNEIQDALNTAFEIIEAREKPPFVRNFKIYPRTSAKWQKEFLKPYLTSQKITTRWLVELALKNSDSLQSRLDAILCIEQFGTNEAVAALSEVSKKATRDVRKEAEAATQRVKAAQEQTLKPKIETSSPLQTRKRQLLAKLNETDDLVGFLHKYHGNETKRDLTTIASDRELNNSKDGIKSRVKAIICLGVIGKRRTQGILKSISESDPDKFIRDAASEAADFIENRILKDSDEQMKEEFLSRFKSLVKIGQLVDHEAINDLLQEFDTTEFKLKLEALLIGLISTERNDFEYFTANNSQYYISDFEYEGLQKLAIYSLGQIGDTKTAEFLNGCINSPPNDNVANLKQDIARVINKIKGIPEPKLARSSPLAAPQNTTSAVVTVASPQTKNPEIDRVVKEIAKHFVKPEGSKGKKTGQLEEITVHQIGESLGSAIFAYARSKHTTREKIAEKLGISVSDLYHELYDVTLAHLPEFRPKTLDTGPSKASRRAGF